MQLDVSRPWKQLQNMGNGFLEALPYILVAILLLVTFYVIGRLVRRAVVNISLRADRDPSLAAVLGRTTQYVIVGLGLLIAMTIIFPSFRPNDLIQILGLMSLAIGFAFKDVFQNFMAGVILSLARPFRVGDQVNVKDLEGTVEEIQTGTMSIRTYDNRLIVVPNSIVFTEPVTVLTGYEKRRSEIELNIGYGEDIEEVKRIVLECVQAAEGVEEDPRPDVLTVKLGEKLITLRLRWWTVPRRGDVLRVQDRVLSHVKSVLAEKGIEPFHSSIE